MSEHARAASRSTNSSKRRWLIAATGILVAVIAVIMFSRRFIDQPPVFHKADRTFAELVSVPPTSVYGSSIHLWVYEDDQHEPQEVAVTGHADANTCARVSRLLFSTALQKNLESEDLLVAGAARLARHESPTERARLKQLENVKKYVVLAQKLKMSEFLLQLGSQSLLTSSRDDQSALSQFKKEAADLEKQVKEAEDDPDVKAYLRETQSGVALPGFIREAERIEADSGLVHVHRVPLSIATEVRERIRKAASRATPSVVTFDDLSKKVAGGTAAVLVNTLATGGARNVSIRLPIAELSADSYEEARKLNRGDIESAMIGDARERLRFYGEQRKVMDRELTECKNLSEKQLAERVPLGQTCTKEGICYEPKEPTMITRREYCSEQIPQNRTIVESWSKDAQELLHDIEDDGKKDKDSRTEAINHATMVDSMLRDWDLPVARDQRAFDVWRQQRRAPVWKQINRQLREQKIDVATISGENVVFSVRADGDALIITPVQIVDLSHSVVVSDPKAGATRVLDSWQRREIKTAEAPADTKGVARTLASRSLSETSTNPKRASEDFRQAFSADPRAAAESVMNSWQALFPTDSPRLKDSRTQVESWVHLVDFHEQLQTMLQNPEIKESPDKSIVALRSLLDASPDAPPEYHLVLAQRTADFIAAATQQIDHDAVTGGSWPVVIFYADQHQPPQGMGGMIAKWQSQKLASAEKYDATRVQDRVKELMDAVKEHIDSESEPYVKGRVMVAALLGADPAEIIQHAVARAKRLDPDFWQRAVAEEKVPREPSTAEKRFNEETSRGRDPIVLEATSLTRIDSLLRSHDHALQGATHFFEGGAGPKERDDEAAEKSAVMVGKALEQLNAATQTSNVSGDELLVALRDHVADLQHATSPLDTLTRIELGSKARLGAERLLLRAAQISEEADSLNLFREHATLTARVEFEKGGYGRALERLFRSKVPLAQSSPRMVWTPQQGDGPWNGSTVSAAVEGNTVVVFTGSGASRRDALRLDNCTNPTAIADAIGGQRFTQNVVLSSQVLLVPVPLELSARRVRDFIMTEPQRSILLKAMVYACAAPGSDVIPHSERCEAPQPEANGKKAPVLAEVTVPDLTVLRAAANHLLKGEE